jgi:hypothetical protein
MATPSMSRQTGTYGGESSQRAIVRQRNPVRHGRQKIAQDLVLGRPRQQEKSRRDERELPRMKSWGIGAERRTVFGNRILQTRGLSRLSLNLFWQETGIRGAYFAFCSQFAFFFRKSQTATPCMSRQTGTYGGESSQRPIVRQRNPVRHGRQKIAQDFSPG